MIDDIVSTSSTLMEPDPPRLLEIFFTAYFLASLANAVHVLLGFFRIDLAHDVFGRERHCLHKDDMGGVGTFDKECRTLYVGGLAHRTKLERLLWTEFGEWGEIEVNIL